MAHFWSYSAIINGNYRQLRLFSLSFWTFEGTEFVTDAQNENKNQEDIVFYGIALGDLLAMDRVNVDAWAVNFNHLNSQGMTVMMEIHEVAVNELLSGTTLPFAVSEIMTKLQDNEARCTSEYPSVNWKRVKRDFERMEEKGHICLFEGNDPATIKVRYRTKQVFRDIVLDYYEQYAKTVRICMTKMQMNDSAASFAELVSDNPDLMSELGLEEQDD